MEIWIIERRDRRINRWREVWRSRDEGESRYELWNRVCQDGDNEDGRVYRVRREDA